MEEKKAGKKRGKLIALIALIVVLIGGVTAGIVYAVTSQQESEDSSGSKKKKSKKDKKKKQKDEDKKDDEDDEDDDDDNGAETERLPLTVCRYSCGGGMDGSLDEAELRRVSDSEAMLTICSRDSFDDKEIAKTWTVGAICFEDLDALIVKYDLDQVKGRDFSKNQLLDGAISSVYYQYEDGSFVSVSTQLDLTDREEEGLYEISSLLYSFAVGEPESTTVDGVPIEELSLEEEGIREALDFDYYDAERMNAEQLGEWEEYFTDDDLGFFSTYYYRPELIDWTSVLYNGEYLGTEFSYDDLDNLVKEKTGTSYREARCPLSVDQFTPLSIDHSDAQEIRYAIVDLAGVQRRPVKFVEGYLSQDGNSCQLWYLFGDKAREDQMPYDGYVIMKFGEAGWQFVANIPVEDSVPRSLVTIDFYPDNAFSEIEGMHPEEMYEIEEKPGDQPEMWLWAVIRAREDDLKLKIERADHTVQEADRLLAEGIFPAGETVLEYEGLQEGEFIAVRVNLSWQPDIRLIAEETHTMGGDMLRRGEYRFGEELYLWNTEEDEVPPKTWVTGETGRNPYSTQADEGVTIADYLGDWTDHVSGRCYMEITESKGGAHVEIRWGDSAVRTYVWKLDCTLDAGTGSLVYKNGYLGTEDDGDKSVELYKNGTGSLTMRNGFIFWQDDIEDQGAECQFVRQ